MRLSTFPLLIALILLLGYAGEASSATDVGYRDLSFNASSVGSNR